MLSISDQNVTYVVTISRSKWLTMYAWNGRNMVIEKRVSLNLQGSLIYFETHHKELVILSTKSLILFDLFGETHVNDYKCNAIDNDDEPFDEKTRHPRMKENLSPEKFVR
ncbi:hypothetical protein AB6A40_011313 [Gnathostoma spinigerum]|uniref:Uncharacterized protein n=1 Tax=Gnathostoma spinigerum TaxID=75299 RepID=A0ABD6F358_9BILA